MKIDAFTKISDLIRYNKDSIETIASLSKPLEKLRNPILRRIMASRVTIAEASNIGNCPINIMMNALEANGFEYDKTSLQSLATETITPQWLKQLPSKSIVQYDVREIIDLGNDPLKEILQRFKNIEVGEALCIINKFVPTPLIHLLEKENTLTFTQSINENEFHSYFYKKGDKNFEKSKTNELKTLIHKVHMQDFYQKLSLYQEKQICELDVRHLEMPKPMQTILQALCDLNKEEVLLIHHKRIPIYLLEEITERNYTIYLYEVNDKNVELLISHKNE